MRRLRWGVDVEGDVEGVRRRRRAVVREGAERDEYGAASRLLRQAEALEAKPTASAEAEQQRGRAARRTAAHGRA